MTGRTVGFALGMMIATLGMTDRAQAGSAGDFTVGVEPSYFAGRYGTSHMIHIYDLPLSVAYQSGPLRLRIELPYIAISGSGLVIGGTAVSSGHAADLRSGPGDVWLQGEYRLNRVDGILPSVEPYLKIKVPVASYSDGLGTGRPDEEFGSRFSWEIGRHIFPFIRLGYRLIGQVPSLHLQNIFTFGPGVTVVPAEHQYVTALLIGHTAIQQNRHPAISLVVAYNFRISTRWELQAYLAHGLTAGSADIGGGLGVLTHF